MKIEDKEYSLNQLKETGFDTDAYEHPFEPTVVKGTLDCRCWGKGKASYSLILYITSDDGGRYLGFAWGTNPKNKYLGARGIHIGDRVEAVYGVTKRSGKVTLESITAIQ